MACANPQPASQMNNISDLQTRNIDLCGTLDRFQQADHYERCAKLICRIALYGNDSIMLTTKLIV